MSESFNGQSLIIGAVLIAVGVIATGSGAFVTEAGSFADPYPSETDWIQDASMTSNVDSVSSTLSIDNTTSETGTFKSFIVDRDVAGQRITGLTYDASDIKPSQDQQLDITLYALADDNSIIKEDTIQVRESGRFVQDEILENTSEEGYAKYQFEVNLETTTDTSPKLNSLEIRGNTIRQQGGGINLGIAMLLIMVGFFMVFKEL